MHKQSEIKQAILSGKNAFVLGPQLILPFRCHVLKITIDRETFTNIYEKFKFVETPQNTLIVLRKGVWFDPSIHSSIDVTIVACDWGVDLTDPSTHEIFKVHIGPTHTAKLELLSQDQLYIE